MRSAAVESSAGGDVPDVALPVVDFGPQLAGLLPRGADRCVVARPQRSDAERRALFAPMSQAEELAWLPGGEVLAYASAEREQRGGPGARVTYLRVEGGRDAVRQAFEQGSGMSVRWGDFDCGADGCRRVRAAFVGEGLLRIERGRFRPGSRPGAERRCRALVKERPDALEVAATRARSVQRGGLVLPLRGSSVTHASSRGVRVVREELMASREAAALVLEDGARGMALLTPLRVQGVAPRLEVEGELVRRELSLLWEDLALRRDDRRRLREAEQRADALERMKPAGDVDLRDREAVVAQVGYRLGSLRTGSDERDGLRAEVRGLLEGALGVAPGDEGLALMLVELLLSSRGEEADARPFIERFVDQPGRDGRWKLYRRHVAALTGARELAAALLADELVPRGKARRAARAIIERLPTAASYSSAEREVLTALGDEAAGRQRPR